MKPKIKEKIKNNLPKITSFYLFFGLITVLPIITFLLPKKDFSEIENRVLSDFPKFSVSSVLDRSFMKNSENYFADHFVGRTDWIKAKTEIELLSGKKEINGVYMKICAIICEYNPLHYGHLYHIEKARELSGCDAVMCIQ